VRVDVSKAGRLSDDQRLKGVSDLVGTGQHLAPVAFAIDRCQMSSN
jgi:hypothetical protein